MTFSPPNPFKGKKHYDLFTKVKTLVGFYLTHYKSSLFIVSFF